MRPGALLAAMAGLASSVPAPPPLGGPRPRSRGWTTEAPGTCAKRNRRARAAAKAARQARKRQGKT